MDKELQAKVDCLEQFSRSYFEYLQTLIKEALKKQPYNLSLTKFHILKYIANGNQRMVVDISNTVRLTSGATTIILNQLEDESLIQRKRDQKDRRIVWISLTEEGRQLVEKVAEPRNLFWSEVLSALTPEEQDEYLRMLEKIESRIKEKKMIR